MAHLTLTKHHGLANDFLVLVDLDDIHGRATADLALALCDRHRGIGADGLIRLGPGLRMELRNADGSRAEMSGNGIRCLAQAIVDSGVEQETSFEITTDAGARWVAVGPDDGQGVRQVSVDMGPARITASGDMWAEVDTGNPHLVMRDEGQDLLELGRRHADVNVELVSGGGLDLTMRVHERGVGLTQACGTGSCASAAAAHAWGLSGTSVTVHNPGGDVVVELKDETVLLTGPTQYIGRIEVPWLSGGLSWH